MSGALTVTVEPVAEPVGLEEMKDYLRVDASDEDALITSLLIAARQYCEAKTKWSFVTQTLRYTLDDWPNEETIELPQPFNDTTTFSVTYYTEGSTSGTVLGSTNYWVDAESNPGRVVLRSGQYWPSGALRSANAVQIVFEAGYGGQGDVPEGVRMAIKLLVGHWYANREAVLTGTISKPIEFGVDSLLSPFTSPYIA